mmetsp:Transcript_10222/g.23004  ORF Transcript_10222/g.23004 Transcript_10222/m.23004 type:complete len:236 (-) Transcript_10222:135-842(-)
MATTWLLRSNGRVHCGRLPWTGPAGPWACPSSTSTGEVPQRLPSAPTRWRPEFSRSSTIITRRPMPNCSSGSIASFPSSLHRIGCQSSPASAERPACSHWSGSRAGRSSRSPILPRELRWWTWPWRLASPPSFSPVSCMPIRMRATCSSLMMAAWPFWTLVSWAQWSRRSWRASRPASSTSSLKIGSPWPGSSRMLASSPGLRMAAFRKCSTPRLESLSTRHAPTPSSPLHWRSR